MISSLGRHSQVDIPVRDTGLGLGNIVAWKGMPPLIVTKLTFFVLLNLLLTITSSVGREVTALLSPISPGL